MSYEDTNERVEQSEVGNAYDALPERTKVVAGVILDLIARIDEGTEVTTGGLVSWLVEEEQEPGFVEDGIADELRAIQDSETGLGELDLALRHDAKSHGIVLDSSEYEHMLMGLPYNIPFVVRRDD